MNRLNIRCVIKIQSRKCTLILRSQLQCCRLQRLLSTAERIYDVHPFVHRFDRRFREISSEIIRPLNGAAFLTGKR